MLKDYFGNFWMMYVAVALTLISRIDTTAFADTGYNINAVKDNQESSSTQKRMCNNTICVHLYKTRNSDYAALSQCNEIRYLVFKNTKSSPTLIEFFMFAKRMVCSDN